MEVSKSVGMAAVQPFWAINMNFWSGSPFPWAWKNLAWQSIFVFGLEENGHISECSHQETLCFHWNLFFFIDYFHYEWILHWFFAKDEFVNNKHVSGYIQTNTNITVPGMGKKTYFTWCHMTDSWTYFFRCAMVLFPNKYTVHTAHISAFEGFWMA